MILIANGIGLSLLGALGLRYSIMTVERYKAFRDSIIKCYEQLGHVQGDENLFIKNHEFLKIPRKGID